MPPANACDAHVHVFGDPARYPYVAERSFTPASGQTLAALDALHGTLGFVRSVIVQSGVQGAAVMLDALRAEPERLRGIAVLKGDVSDATLQDLHEAGVRGVRVNLFHRNGVQVYRGGTTFPDLGRVDGIPGMLF